MIQLASAILKTCDFDFEVDEKDLVTKYLDPKRI